MAKPDPEALREAGERLLAEWGIADDADTAALGAALHRDAADAAIAHRLGALASEASARLLRQLETEATDKGVRKIAKRALYRLEQRGIHAPVATEPAAPAPIMGPAMEGYISPVDGRGDQLVWILKPRPGGVSHLFAVINDPEGLREAALSEVSRKQLKALQGELERKHALRLLAVDWHYADFLMHRAFGWSRQRGTRMEGDYPALRNQLTRTAAPEDLPPAVLTQIDAATVGDAQLAESAGLLEEPEFRTWFVDPEQLQPFLEELAGAQESPLVLNEAQQQDRFADVIGRAVEAIFAPDTRPAWSRRLYEMAYIFAVTRRRLRAEQAIAAARAMAQSLPARDIPFAAVLVRASLAGLFQSAVEQQQQRQQSSLIVTPQQHARQRERR